VLIGCRTGGSVAVWGYLTARLLNYRNVDGRVPLERVNTHTCHWPFMQVVFVFQLELLHATSCRKPLYACSNLANEMVKLEERGRPSKHRGYAPCSALKSIFRRTSSWSPRLGNNNSNHQKAWEQRPTRMSTESLNESRKALCGISELTVGGEI
jgi:hypothetical protein